MNTHTYKKAPLTESGNFQNWVFRIEDRCVIPFSEGNTDYQKYLAWLAEGNEPLPADN